MSRMRCRGCSLGAELSDSQVHHLSDADATEALGAWLWRELGNRYGYRAVVFLSGDLGAGKTTLVRGLLHAAGHEGVVKSPTYTLLEPYNIGELEVFHFDLYRVNDPVELEFVGIDEIVDGPGVKLFEWPERAADWLPAPQVHVRLEVDPATVPPARRAHVEFS